jgi:hypothetical protein
MTLNVYPTSLEPVSQPRTREEALEAALFAYVMKHGMSDIARAAIMFRPQPEAVIASEAGRPVGLKSA